MLHGRKVRYFKKYGCHISVETFDDGDAFIQAVDIAPNSDPRLAITGFLQNSRKWKAKGDMTVCGHGGTCFLCPK